MALKQIKKLEDLKLKNRDKNILMHIKREINLSTRKVGRKKYSRKIKHKEKIW